jgi:hypothetical protein
MAKELEQQSFEELSDTLSRGKQNAAEKHISKEDYQTLLSGIKNVAEKRSAIPTHQEITDVYEYGTSTTKVDLASACVEMGLKTALENGQEITHIDQMIMAEGESFNEFMQREFSDPSNPGRPQVYAQQVSKAEGMLFSKEKPTDEVLIVVRLNNSMLDGEGTVVSALVKFDRGKPDFSNGLLKVESEKEYLDCLQGLGYTTKSQGTENKNIKPKPNHYSTRLASGEITRKEYEELFKRENWISIYDHWNKWDKELKTNIYAGKSERLKGELMTRLEGRYESLLQETTEANQKVIKEIDESLEKHLERAQRLSNTQHFQEILASLPNLSPEQLESTLTFFRKVYKFEDADIENLRMLYAEYKKKLKRDQNQQQNFGTNQYPPQSNGQSYKGTSSRVRRRHGGVAA